MEEGGISGEKAKPDQYGKSFLPGRDQTNEALID